MAVYVCRWTSKFTANISELEKSLRWSAGSLGTLGKSE